jgi:hypothetical protein
MGGFLQLSVKRRKKPDGFLDALNDEYKKYKGDIRNIGHKLKEMVGTWLIEERILENPPDENDEVTPLQIAAVIMSRMCQISGHAWLEFVEGPDLGKLSGTAAPNRQSIRAHLVEFTPALTTRDVADAFGASDGRSLPWDQVSNAHLLRLFEKLLDPAPTFEQPLVNSEREPAGAVKGELYWLSPEEVREETESWFKDRQEAFITPAWEIKDEFIETLKQTTVRGHYSFTPEFYPDEADNCVTWVSRAISGVSPGNWVETIRIQCAIDINVLDKGKCKEYNRIQEQGRMRCIEYHAAEADKYRRDGLRIFA